MDGKTQCRGVSSNFFKVTELSRCRRKGNPSLGHRHHACFVSTASLCILKHPRVAPTLAPLRHALILATLPRMRVGRWSRVHPPHLPLSKGRTSGCPSFHSAPQMSGIWSSSLKACKGHFLEEPALTNLAFFSCQGKSMGGRAPWPLSSLRSRTQQSPCWRQQARAPGSAPTRYSVMPGSMLEHTGPCRVTLSASLDRGGN